MNSKEAKILINTLLENKDKWIEFSKIFPRGEQIVKSLFKIESELEMYGKTATFPINSKFIYKGMTFPIVGVYIRYTDGYGVYEDGSCDLILDISNSEFEGKTTVIHESHLLIN